MDKCNVKELKDLIPALPEPAPKPREPQLRFTKHLNDTNFKVNDNPSYQPGDWKHVIHIANNTYLAYDDIVDDGSIYIGVYE